MAAKQPRTIEELSTAGVRFVVGSKKANYINGKSKISVPTLAVTQAKATIEYYEQMAMGETILFELVPCEVNADGTISRMT